MGIFTSYFAWFYFVFVTESDSTCDWHQAGQSPASTTHVLDSTFHDGCLNTAQLLVKLLPLPQRTLGADRSLPDCEAQESS